MKNRAPEGVSHAATSGLRLAFHAAFVGSIRPGLNLQESDGVRVSFVSQAWNEREVDAYVRVTWPSEPTMGSVASSAPPAGDPGTRLNFELLNLPWWNDDR